MNTNAVARLEERIDKGMTSQMQVTSSGITFRSASEVMEFAKMMAVSGSAVPKHLRGEPGACLGIIDDAIRFEMSPYALARKSYFVNDNLAYEAQVLAAIVIARSPLTERPDVQYDGEGQTRRCQVIGHFVDGAVRDYRSPPLAQISPKNSPLWRTDPDQQLAYYSLRAFARRHCPDVLLGIYDFDEMSAARAKDVTPDRPDISAKLSKAPASTGFPRDRIDTETGEITTDPAQDGDGASEEPDAPAKSTSPAGEAPASQDKALGDEVSEDLFGGPARPTPPGPAYIGGEPANSIGDIQDDDIAADSSPAAVRPATNPTPVAGTGERVESSVLSPDAPDETLQPLTPEQSGELRMKILNRLEMVETAEELAAWKNAIRADYKRLFPKDEKFVSAAYEKLKAKVEGPAA